MNVIVGMSVDKSHNALFYRPLDISENSQECSELL